MDVLLDVSRNSGESGISYLFAPLTRGKRPRRGAEGVGGHSSVCLLIVKRQKKKKIIVHQLPLGAPGVNCEWRVGVGVGGGGGVLPYSSLLSRPLFAPTGGSGSPKRSEKVKALVSGRMSVSGRRERRKEPFRSRSSLHAPPAWLLETKTLSFTSRDLQNRWFALLSSRVSTSSDLRTSVPSCV